MREHLDVTMLNALVSGELSSEERSAASEHLAECASCTAGALSSGMLKLATAKAGVRYAPSPQFAERIARQSRGLHVVSKPSSQRAMVGWAIAAVVAIAALVSFATLHRDQRNEVAMLTRSALAREVVDRHIAALATDSPFEVASSDKHTVKPWFQGKLPFSFNLPETLPEGTMLEGANLTYLYGQPAAQLIYRVRKHRVSVFLMAKSDAGEPPVEEAGFQVRTFTTDHFTALAVSDVNAGDLDALTKAFKEAQ
jgi:anti-sigma factor RsiW